MKLLLLCILTWLLVLKASCENTQTVKLLTVRLEGNASELSTRFPENLEWLGPVGDLVGGYHLFRLHLREGKGARALFSALEDEGSISDFYEEHKRERYHRAIKINDPLFSEQWHLDRLGVRNLWDMGITGQGVVVSVVDDGLAYEHPEFQRRYVPEASYDFNEFHPDPLPRYLADVHGTRCSGEISAEAGNNVCGVGVAPDSGIAATRILGGDVYDSLEAAALSYRSQIVSIYSCSWGPSDDGSTAELPGPLATKAFEQGAILGRGGLGSVFVFASGNGGAHDNCGFDGYVGSIYTIAVGAIDARDQTPEYQEMCSALMAVTYSSGAGKTITTADVRGCTSMHGGTSAAAPVAAGVFALVLQARPDLHWRDLQWLIVSSAKKITSNPGWHTNGAGYSHHHLMGFGKLDAESLVAAAKDWQSLWPIHPQLNFTFFSSPEQEDSNIAVELSGFVLEHVVVRFAVSRYNRRGEIDATVISAQGTPSVLITTRPKDHTPPPPKHLSWEWQVLTVRCWGENPSGVWKLKINNANLDFWSIQLFGYML